LLRRLGMMMTEPDPAVRRTLASEARFALAAIETDLKLAGYEPEAVRPPENWLSARREVARDIGALEGLLLLSANRDKAQSAPIARRLEHFADRFAASDLRPPAPPVISRAGWKAPPLESIVDRGLRRLERAPI
jgi:hypothetical protein